MTFSKSRILEYSDGEGNGIPLRYSCLENPTDRGTWWAAVHGVAKGWTWLSYFPFTFHFHVLEKEMATHSSVLAWRIPGMAEPGGLPSTGSPRVRHDWRDLAAAAAAAEYSENCHHFHSLGFIWMQSKALLILLDSIKSFFQPKLTRRKYMSLWSDWLQWLGC